MVIFNSYVKLPEGSGWVVPRAGVGHVSDSEKQLFNGAVRRIYTFRQRSGLVNRNFRILTWRYLHVPTIYKAYVSGLCKGTSPQNMVLYGTVPPFLDPEIPIDGLVKQQSLGFLR